MVIYVEYGLAFNGSLAQIKTYYKFESDMEFARWVGTSFSYEHILAHQRVTKTDIERVWFTDDYREPLVYDRYIQIFDEYGRTLNIRDFKPLIDIASEMSFSELRAISRRNNYHPHNRRQGKTHRKWGHYKSFYKYSGVSLRPDKRDYEDCGEYVTYLHHKNRKPNNDFGYWNDRFAPTENNWKEKKIRKQYMWHKPCHCDTHKEKEQND